MSCLRCYTCVECSLAKAVPSQPPPRPQWTSVPPTEPGWYWLHDSGHTRLVKVWRFGLVTKLYTNEDGGAAVTDEMYAKCKWWPLPLTPPEAP